MQILKLFFGRREDGVWAIQSMKPMPLDPEDGQEGDFYEVKDDLFVADRSVLGTIRSIMGQSIVPIVSHTVGENVLRCLGTGFFVSCSGLLVTAAHVVTDPVGRGCAAARETEDQTLLWDNAKVGVMIPLNPLRGVGGYMFREIQWAAFLAERTENPLPIAGLDLRLTSDTALCRVVPIAEGVPYQPLSTIQPGLRGLGMAVGKGMSAIGYGGMRDVELKDEGNGALSGDFNFDLHVSRGQIIERFPDNAVARHVPAPGPCFSASAKLPAGMSGGPIFDDERIYVHGVVSKGWEDENGPINFGYGSMLLPTMSLPLRVLGGRSLFDLMQSVEHGIPQLHVPDA